MKKYVIYPIIGFSLLYSLSASAAPLWQDIKVENNQARASSFRSVRINWDSLDNILAKQVKKEISLPLPDGGFMVFSIHENNLMSPELAAKYPEIKSYSGFAIDNHAITVQLDKTPNGFHAMILGDGLNIYIDPTNLTNIDDYISYHKHNLINSPQHFCKTKTKDLIQQAKSKQNNLNRSNGLEKKTYRLAVAATGEYSAVFGGTKSGALAQIVTTINRVTGIYEKDLAVTFQLIGNTDSIIYTDATTDPFNNNDADVLIDQNQTNTDAVIGTANYDIGHVVSTGGGGLAGLGVVCNSNQKANGVTGSPKPSGDGFDVDFVAHEMGHQFGGNHSFNGTDDNCGPSRVSFNAYEPNSGSTIMAYAGICDSENLELHSHDNFHSKSLGEIQDYLSFAPGNTCGDISLSGNKIPTANAGIDYSIPAQTPFTLTGTGSDADAGDVLSYSWEQVDLGEASSSTSLSVDSGNRPIFRSFSPTAIPSRTFPKISDIIGNTQTIGEVLPTTTRTLNFELIVRDNHQGSGAYSTSLAKVGVDSNSGPFKVTAPNTNVTITGNTTETVTWDVASTDQPPVNCTQVKILLSTDGGNTAPITVLDNVINDGSETVTIPNINTTTARIKIMCVNNIFFDISDQNFTITKGANADTTPDAFTFVDQTNVALNSLIMSNAITIAGIDTATLVTVSGGEYEIDGNNTWLTTSSMVNNGQAIKVRQTSSTSFSTATNTVLTIGGVADTFTITTQVKSAIIKGDANGDNLLNVNDIIVVVNLILTSGTVTPANDCNGDGNLNVNDIVCLINIILAP